MIDPDEALKQAAQLAADAAEGLYTVDGCRMDGGEVACILAEFLDRASPETAPHAWRQTREGFTFRANVWGTGRATS